MSINQSYSQQRAAIRHKDYNISLKEFNNFLSTLEPHINQFNPQHLEPVRNILKMILEDLEYLQLHPIIQIWRINFTDLLGATFNLQFARSLCTYYIQLSECSQIFRSALFNEVNKQICQILCVICWDRNISDEVRHNKCLRSLIRMLRVNCTDDLLACMAIVSKNFKNSEYMAIKKTQDQLLQLYRNNISRDLIQLIIANMCFNNDQRLLFWCQGILSVVRLTLDVSSLTLIWKLLYDCPEVVEELLKQAEFFNHIYKKINSIGEESALLIAIVRKICECNQGYREEHIENIMLVFSALIDNCQNQSPKQYQLHPSIKLFILKEVFSFFGLVGSKFISPQTIPNIISLIYDNINDSKLLTVGIGMLTNLSTSQLILNIISNDKIFYQLILQVLENFNDKQQLIEYTLKLMINTLCNQIVSLQFGQPRFIMKLLFIWHINPENISLNSLIIRILRGLYIVTNTNAQILSQCINEIETRNSAFNFINICTSTIQICLQQNKFDIIVEIFMLISVIPGLRLNTPSFQNILKTYVETMKAKGELKKALQTVSNLPIEDIGLQF